MSNYYNKHYSRSGRQHTNFRNRYDDKYEGYEYYDNNHQQFQLQQRQNQYNYYHSNVDRQNQYYTNNNRYQYKRGYNNNNNNNNNNNTYKNSDNNGYYYDDEDTDKYYENNTRHNEYGEYQHANHQSNDNKLSSYHQKAVKEQNDYKSRDKTSNIRDMNNWCKYVNITHSIREAYKGNDNYKINILDLGCGKGGDLYKCRGNKKYIKKYLGIDISSECIINARQKYSKILETNIIHRNASYEQRKKFGLDNAYGQTAHEFFDEPIFDAQFVCDDMNSPCLSTQNLINSNKPFHLINIQFALHYSFQSKMTLLSLFNTFNKYIKYGSYFICSFVRDDIIIKRLSKEMNNNKDNNEEAVCFKTEYQSITMKKSDFKRIENIYKQHNLLKFDVNSIYIMNKNENNDICDQLIGIPYMYYQLDSVEGDNGNGVEEYLISFPILCKLLWKYCRMKLVYKKTCCDIYIESSRAFPYKYGYSKGRELDHVKWTNDEQSVIDTYCYALFKRM